ncbi:MAG: RpiB/LacA/LacB family sugar-phosphate isomerase [Planctomycetes bacterium]|nr:RpiB/LacA/LacB family sugar-phosphate isomerase [Planctomycetota bacterium]
MAERGRALHLAGQPAAPGAGRPAGVQVALTGAGGPDRPATDESAAPARRGVALVTARDLEGVPEGGSHFVPRGALVTDLAREEAGRRGIRLEERVAGRPAVTRIALGADHGGVRLKGDLAELLRSLGVEVLDVGTRGEDPVDYPDFARAAAELVARGEAHLGIVVDGAGIGSAMAANKVPGVRAANCWDEATAQNAREHNYANVLTLGARHLTPEAARKVVRAFLATNEGEARHGRRVAKITEIERRYAR